MTSKEDLAILYNKIDEISAIAIKNSFVPFEIAKDVDFISDTLNQITKDLEVLEILKKYAYEINFSIENEDTKKVEDWLYDDK